ncbi:MAG: hypothetical protein ACERLG_07405 [Sedimentibacter sp.]
MALKKPSSFGAAADLFTSTQQVHEVQEEETLKSQNRSNVAHDVQQVHEVQKVLGTTQGKKGQKLKRINMAFSDINHDYITKESRRQGMSGTAFVNMIIDQYRIK